MNEFSKYERMVESVTFKYSNKIKKYTQNIRNCLNASDFRYFRISSRGDFFFVGSYLEWSEYFVDKKLIFNIPYYRSPSFFKSCLLSLNQIKTPEFSMVNQAAIVKFNSYHKYLWLRKEGGDLEGFGLAANSPDNVLMLDDIPLFKFFAKKFKEENRFLLDKAKENSINLHELLGENFLETCSFTIPKNFYQREILKNIQALTSSLTRREVEVIQQILLGYSAGQTGKILCLSKRTVEHHIERIKIKLNCSSKAELIQKTKELEQIGCFEPEF